MNECVILRGIGGFETSYRNAVFRKDKKMLVPPSKKIIFHPDWIRDNKVLEDYISKNLGITSDEAADTIDHFVQGIHNDLRKDGKVILKGIGEFTRDENDIIHYHEPEGVNFLADSFGLETITLETVPVKETEISPPDLKPIETRPRKHTGLYVVIGVLLLLISVTLIILIADSKNIAIFGFAESSEDKNEIVIFGPAKTDSLTRSVEKALDDRTSFKNALKMESVPVDEKPRRNHISPPGDGTVYYLIAGSFNSRRNAEVLNEQLSRKGFTSEIIYVNNSQYRVVVGTFTDRLQALEELRRMKVQLSQSIWLYETKMN